MSIDADVLVVELATVRESFLAVEEESGAAQYEWLQPVSFRFEGAAPDLERIYLWADFFGSRQFIASVPRGADGAFVHQTRLRPGQEVRFQIYDRLPLGEGLLAPTEARTRAVVARVDAAPTILTYSLNP